MGWQDDHLERAERGKWPKVYDPADPEFFYPIDNKDPRLRQEALQESDVYRDPTQSPTHRTGPELLEDTERQGFDDEYQPNPNYVDPASDSPSAAVMDALMLREKRRRY